MKSFESRFGEPRLTPEEQKAREEKQRREKILQDQQGEKARKLLEKELEEKLTPEEIARAGKAGREREERGQ